MNLAGRERAHHPVLRILLQAAVQQGHAVCREDVVREVIRHLRRRAQIRLLRLLDDRVHDVRLASGVQLGSEKRVDLVAPRVGLRDGAHRRASRRQVADRRHVEVAIGRDRKRPRDGRRGHHQHVGLQPLLAQQRPLQHTEPVLLVDDHEAERLEPHRLLHQGMRAHHQVHLAGGDRLARAAALGGGKTPGQQRDPEPRARQQPLHGREVLLGEDFGGRHERDLLPVLHREHRREHGNDRLAGTDVALQQAVHRMRALHVVGDLLQRHALTRREAKRQHGPQRVADAIVHTRHQRLALGLGLPLAQQQPHLEAEELLEDQTPLRGRPIGVERVERRAGRGEVHLLERGPAVRKPEARADIRPATDRRGPAGAAAARRRRAAAASSA